MRLTKLPMKCLKKNSFKMNLTSPKSFMDKLLTKKPASEEALNNFLQRDFII